MQMKMGWRFKKRPGLDYFLQKVAEAGYEVVIFTKETAAVSITLGVLFFTPLLEFGLC